MGSPGAHRELLEAIRAREHGLAPSEDAALRDAAAALRVRARNGSPRADLLVDCFALTSEIAWRALGQRPFDEQILAGLALQEGRMVEMQTGEGKTLAAVAPLALEGLAGGGVHLLTFNDYLAARDAEWMGPIYRELGLTVSFVREGLDAARRRSAYGSDVTYLTVKQAGFDYLRDGICLETGDRVQRALSFALVDEADSIMIDEARIPLVIAGSIDDPGADPAQIASIARRLKPGEEVGTDEYARNVFLTERGVARVETTLGCGNLYSTRNNRLLADLRNALHAAFLLRRDVDYIVREGRIELVDELTGRVAENRHWPDGLQTAVEAKEGLVPRQEGRILASIAIQHFLGKYPRLSGMTATARPAARELAEVYRLEVVTIPTHRPCVRVDQPDMVFADRAAKRRALIEEVARVHAASRPVLVGTISVQESDGLAADLRAAGIGCSVLNARNDAQEAAIIAQAGAPGAVTISTNMAGRGTDIRLGGADGRESARVASLGGLHVIGTNRHESRRIDEQLRGRAGRQGDPGSSRFLISLEDDLPRRYGMRKLLPSIYFDPEFSAGHGLTQRAVHREVARLQRIVEGQHGDIRKRLLETARLIEQQRVALQRWRREVLEGTVGPGLLPERSPQRWEAMLSVCGEEQLRLIEGRLTLLAIDRCWSEHLADMQALRDEVHLVTLSGKDPLTEFYREAREAFERLLVRVDDRVLETFERIEIRAGGVDWDREGLRGPSSTWTYLVDDNVFGSNLFMSLARNPAIAAWAVLAHAPLLIVWGAVLRWRRWRRARSVRDGEHGDPVVLAVGDEEPAGTRDSET